MTFNEFVAEWRKQVREYGGGVPQEAIDMAEQSWEIAFAAGAARRDDDLAKLQADLEIERLRLSACGVAALGYFDGCKDEYRSASLDDVLQLVKKNDQLREQVAMLRDALGWYNCGGSNYSARAVKALAATEPK